MALPIIGITCCFDEDNGRVWLSRHYLEAVVAAGGVPLILPIVAPLVVIDQLLTVCSGLLLPGGGDIDPLLFGQQPQPASGEICPRCDRFELEITRQALEIKMPILGICRGAQVLNVAAGGTICQDITYKIKEPLKHSQQAPRYHPTHNINIVADSLLAQILGNNVVQVNSYHHQMVDKLGKDLKVAAFAADGVVESIEHVKTDRFVLGVQYHPELMWQTDVKARALFRYFVQKSN